MKNARVAWLLAIMMAALGSGSARAGDWRAALTNQPYPRNIQVFTFHDSVSTPTNDAGLRLEHRPQPEPNNFAADPTNLIPAHNLGVRIPAGLLRDPAVGV